MGPAIIVALVIALAVFLIVRIRLSPVRKTEQNGMNNVVEIFPEKKRTISVDYKAMFPKLVRNAIKLDFDIGTDTQAKAGSSKFGGQPDMPEGFAWPYYKYIDDNETEQSRPLSFLLQINCGEVSAYDKDRLLPDTGMLYFFYELDSMKWGFDPKDKGSAAVYYFDTGGLVRQPFPRDLAPEYRLQEMQVAFAAKRDLPDYEEFAENNTAEEYDFEEYGGQRTEFGYTEEEGNRSKLLGYADVIQNSMLLECEMAANGIYTGDGGVFAFRNLSEERRKALSENCKQWRLLLQLDSVSKGNFELMFGDCGHIYYYIREGDLAGRNFDNCWLILQCY